MKTLDQWLEDTDEEEEEDDVRHGSSASDARNGSEDRRSSTSRAVSTTRTSGAPSLSGSNISAHTPTTLRPVEHPPGGLYARQEETREKMRRLLGADAVVKATTPTSTIATAAAGGSAAWPISAPPDRSHFPFGATPNSTQPGVQSRWAPPTLGATTATAAGENGGGGTSASARLTPNSHLQLTRTDTATDSSQLPEVEQTMKGFGSSGPVYEAVEVMVVDRGTQTVTSEGTQTDPLPINVGPYYTGPYNPAALQGHYGGAPLFGGYGVLPPPVQPSFGFGVDGRPYRQYLYDYEKKEADEAMKLREQLGMIQNSIDMLIARYNLPPPPL